jgi:hypothetical protein
MNPHHEYNLREMAIGGLRRLADALEAQQPSLRPRAVAYQSAATDIRAIQRLRQLAGGRGASAEVAEQRYRELIDAGWPGNEAFREARAALDQV